MAMVSALWQVNVDGPGGMNVDNGGCKLWVDIPEDIAGLLEDAYERSPTMSKSARESFCLVWQWGTDPERAVVEYKLFPLKKAGPVQIRTSTGKSRKLRRLLDLSVSDMPAMKRPAAALPKALPTRKRRS